LTLGSHGGIIIKPSIFALIAIVIMAVLLAGCTTVSNPGSAQWSAPVSTPVIYNVYITGVNVNIAYEGSTSGYFGSSSQSLPIQALQTTGGQVFADTITVRSSALLLKHDINSIAVTTNGFTLESVNPPLPYEFSPGSSMTFTLNILAPDENFDGPINILISTS
jgi:hypothetical protein